MRGNILAFLFNLPLMLQILCSSAEIEQNYNINWNQELNKTKIILDKTKEKLVFIDNKINDLKKSSSKPFPDVSNVINNHQDIISMKDNLNKVWPDFWNVPRRMKCAKIFEKKVRELIDLVNQNVNVYLESRIEFLRPHLTSIAYSLKISEYVFENYGERYLKECAAAASSTSREKIRNLDQQCPIKEYQISLGKELDDLDATLNSLHLDSLAKIFSHRINQGIQDTVVSSVTVCLSE